MDNLLTVAFQAHHAEKNHHRHYAITVGRDGVAIANGEKPTLRMVG